MSRLRIAHLYRRFRPDFTGDGIFYARLIPLMAESGTDHTVVVFDTPGRPPPSPAISPSIISVTERERGRASP